jgi:hypothetical protein
MNTERRAILSLVAAGRITPAEAERLLAAWNEGRESLWIFACSLIFACLAQLHLQELLKELLHFLSAQSLAGAMPQALSPITDFLGGIL